MALLLNHNRIKVRKKTGQTDTKRDTRPLLYAVVYVRGHIHVYVASDSAFANHCASLKKGKGSPSLITERRVPELIPVLGSQPAGDVSHKPGGRLPLLSARPAVTPATLKRAATNFAAW